MIKHFSGYRIDKPTKTACVHAYFSQVLNKVPYLYRLTLELQCQYQLMHLCFSIYRLKVALMDHHHTFNPLNHLSEASPTTSSKLQCNIFHHLALLLPTQQGHLLARMLPATLLFNLMTVSTANRHAMSVMFLEMTSHSMMMTLYSFR